jgi:hypothetical protein
MKRVSEIIKFNISRSTKTGTIVISNLGIDDKSDLEPIEEAALGKTCGFIFSRWKSKY